MRALAALDAWVNRALAGVAGVALIAMMLFTVADMVLRGVGRPVAGSYEVIGWLSATAMALALGYSQLHRGHVAIDLVVQRMGPRTRAIVEALTSLASLLLFVAVAWYVGRYGMVLHQSGSLSETLKAIVYPWVYVVALGCGGLALALLADFVRALARATGREKGEGRTGTNPLPPASR
ncbi:MAG TPA: TRAP transporter small permease [Zeimonas sp.]